MKQLPPFEHKSLDLPQIDQNTTDLFNFFIYLTKLANRNKKAILAYGGFAVDLAVGRITRNHADLDLAIKEEDIDWFRDEFKKIGFSMGVHEGKSPKYTFTAKKDNLEIDLVTFGIEGDRVFDRDEDEAEKWFWPIKLSDLIYSRDYRGINLKFVSPTLTYDFKKRQSRKDVQREKEDKDFKELESAFPYLKDYKVK